MYNCLPFLLYYFPHLILCYPPPSHKAPGLTINIKDTPRTGKKVVEVVINNSHSPSPHNFHDQTAQLEASDSSDDTELNTPRPERRRFDNNLDRIAPQEDENYPNDRQPKERESVPSSPTYDKQVTEILSQLTIVNTKLEEIGSRTENQVHDLKKEVETLNKTFSLKETQLEETEKEMVYMLEQKSDQWREELMKTAADWKDELQRMAVDWKDELIESLLHRNPSHVSLQWTHRKVE